MADHQDLIRRWRDAVAFGYDEDKLWSLVDETQTALNTLVKERDAWKEDAEDCDAIEGALERYEKLRQEWQDRAEKAEADLAAARAAIRWQQDCCGRPASDEIAAAIEAARKSINKED